MWLKEQRTSSSHPGGVKRSRPTFQQKTTKTLDSIYQTTELRTPDTRQQRIMKLVTWKQKWWVLQLPKLTSWWKFAGHRADRGAEAEGSLHELKTCVSRKAKTEFVVQCPIKERAAQQEFWMSADASPWVFTWALCTHRRQITQGRERTTPKNYKEQYLVPTQGRNSACSERPEYTMSEFTLYQFKGKEGFLILRKN